MCPRRQTQTRDLPPLCAGLDSPLQWLPCSLGILPLWAHFDWLIIGSPSIQSHSEWQEFKTALLLKECYQASQTPERDRKDKANRANSATPWEHMFFSEPCTQLGDWFLCTISLDWKEPYWHLSTHTEQRNTFFSPPSPLFCCRSITWFFPKVRPQQVHWGMLSPFPACNPNPSTPTTKERPIMINSLEHRATMRALLENKKWEELLSRQSTAPTSPGYFVLNLFKVLKSLLKRTPWIS